MELLWITLGFILTSAFLAVAVVTIGLWCRLTLREWRSPGPASNPRSSTIESPDRAIEPPDPADPHPRPASPSVRPAASSERSSRNRDGRRSRQTTANVV